MESNSCFPQIVLQDQDNRQARGSNVGEKSFRCDYEGCGKLYTTAHHLKVSLAVWRCVCMWPACSGVWLFEDSVFTLGAPCLPCRLRCYSFACVLQVHERSHTGDKPYACDYSGCGRKFATGSHGAWDECLSLLLYSFHLETCDLFTSLWPDYIMETIRMFSLYEDMMADSFLWSNSLMRMQEWLQWHSWQIIPGWSGLM